MSTRTRLKILIVLAFAGAFASALVADRGAGAQDRARPQDERPSSFTPVVEEPFEVVLRRDKANKPRVMATAKGLLEARYDLTRRVDSNTKMTRGKPVPVGPTARLKGGVTWEQLGRMSPDEIREKNLFPYLPLPHVNHPVGGMIFPEMHIKLQPRLERFDMDFDIPEHFLPEFPPAIFLTTRPDLGDVSQGQLVTNRNFYQLFSGVLTPKQLEGLRLLTTPFPQQQFNLTSDRRSAEPHLGVACLDCHANGHTNAATHLVGDIRPQHFRHRIDTPSLRGVNVQRLFGSQRALKTVEDFTEFEQRAAYFDGDPVVATKKGLNVLERGSQVHDMGEVQELLDFPPAPKLAWDGKLDPKKATPSELKGQEVFFGKGRCSTCHVPPYYTDNLMHQLPVQRFYEPKDVNGRFDHSGGMTKTFPLRGIKDSPPYLH